MLARILWAGVFALFLAPAVAPAQSCDWSDLPCAQKGKKCNIRFRNFTGRDESTCRGGTRSDASTVKVMAKDDKKNNEGNVLSILADASNTINLEKKKKSKTSSIVVAGGGYDRGTLSCSDIRKILAGNGECKIYLKDTSYDTNLFTGYLFFDCDGGNVCTKPAGY